MVKNLYSIRDVKSTFMPPFIDDNDEVAQRNFAFAISNRPDVIAYAPSDFSLMRIGTFDTESGALVPCLPVFVCDGTCYLKKGVDNS